MKLLILNSSSKLAQGITKRLYESQKFEQIVCADLYPNYAAIQSHFDFQETLGESKTKLIDSKYNEKQDLSNLIKNNSHILHITHNYSTYVTPKQNVLKTSLQIAQDSKVQHFLSVNPLEHDHQYDQDSQVINVQETNPNFGSIKSDFVFGHHGSVFQEMANRLKQADGFTFDPSQQNVHPVYDQDLFQLIEQELFADQKKQITVQGKQSLQFKQILNHLEKWTGRNHSSGSFTDQIASPLSNGFLNSYFHSNEYRNLVQFFKNYVEIQGDKQQTMTLEEFCQKETFQEGRSYSTLEKMIQH